MASAAPPTNPVQFNEEQGKTLSGLAFYAQLLAAALVLMALLKIGIGILLLLSLPLTAVLILVSGALTGLLGMVLLKASADVRYIREVPGLATAHLINAVNSWKDFAQFLAGLAVIMGLLVLLRFAS